MVFNYNKHKKDIALLFFTKATRMFGYGMLAIIFFQSLFFKGFNELQSSQIQVAIVLGDLLISVYLAAKADKFGRVITLMFASLLQIITALVYSESQNQLLLIIVGVVGIISVTGGEIGPFIAIQKSALSKLVEDSTEKTYEISNNIAQVMDYYNATGYIAQGFGSLLAGQIFIYFGQAWSYSEKQAFTNLMRIYAALGALMCFGYYFISNDVLEVDHAYQKKVVACTPNKGSTLKLKVLCAMDALAGALVAQTFITFYYASKYDKNFDQLGIYLLLCNLAAAFGGVLSSKLMNNFGQQARLYADLSANLLLIVIALINDARISLILLICRFCLCQMNVSSRQNLINLIISPAESSTVVNSTKILRSIFFALGLGLNGIFMRINSISFGFSAPFILAGSIKIVYDIAMRSQLLQRQEQLGNSQNMIRISYEYLDESQAMQ